MIVRNFNMARMHSRAKGKSKSKKPLLSNSKQWINYSPEEVEKLAEKIAGTGARESKIGMILRDSYGIPSVKDSTGKKVSLIAKKAINHELPEDLFNLLKRAVKAYKHLEQNKKDFGAKHGYRLIESKIRRIVKYYKDKNVLDSKWAYSIEKARLLVE